MRALKIQCEKYQCIMIKPLEILYIGESFANVTPFPEDGSLKELEIMPTKKAQKAV